MPAWRTIAIASAAVLATGTAGVLAVAGYLIATAEASMEFPDTAYPDVHASTDPAVIAQGRYLAYGPAHCVQCHGDPDRDHPETALDFPPLAGGLVFAMGPIATLRAPNLTPDAETGIGRFTDPELARALRTGVRPNHRFSMFMGMGPARLSVDDEVAIVSFLRSAPPVHNEIPPEEFGVLGKLMLPMFGMAPRTAPPPAGVPAGEEPSLARGEYLVEHVSMCMLCHSPTDPMTGELTGAKGSGSAPEASHGADSDKEFVAPNLTSDPSGITGQLSEDAFITRMRAGRVYPTSIMPWEPFHSITDTDLRSIYRYLQSVPPVHNELGPSYREVGWTPPG